MKYADSNARRSCSLFAHVSGGSKTESENRAGEGGKTRKTLGVFRRGFGCIPSLIVCSARASAAKWL